MTNIAIPDLHNDDWLRFVNSIELASDTAGGDWTRFTELLERCVSEANGLREAEVRSVSDEFALTVALSWGETEAIVEAAIAAVSAYDMPSMQFCRLAAAVADWARRTGYRSRYAAEMYSRAHMRLDSLGARERREAQRILDTNPWPAQ